MRKSSWLMLISGGLLLVLVLVPSLIGALGWSRSLGGNGWNTGYGMMGGFGFPMMGMMGLEMVVFWMLIIGGLVWLGQALARASGAISIPPQGESPLDVVRKRYSRGELTKEQFEAMKRDLGL